MIPEDLPREEMPALLRNWHLGTKVRRYISHRRFVEVDSLLWDIPSRRVLDAGSGWGGNIHMLRSLGLHPVGIDIVQNDFAHAKIIAGANGFEAILVGADLAALPFASGSFGAVTAVETIEHVYADDLPRAIEEVYRVLMPGGVFALSTPNYHSIVEIGKRAIKKFPILMRLFPAMCYPVGKVERGSYHPYRYHRPIEPVQLKRMLGSAGFEISVTRFAIFAWKNTPDFLFPIAKLLESILEKLPLICNLGSTLFVRAVKRAKESPAAAI